MTFWSFIYLTFQLYSFYSVLFGCFYFSNEIFYLSIHLKCIFLHHMEQSYNRCLKSLSENSNLWVTLGASNDCPSLENFVVPLMSCYSGFSPGIFTIVLRRLWVLFKFSGKFFFFFNANSESNWVRPQAPCHLPWAVVSISVQLSRSLLWGHGSAPSRAQQGAQDRSSFVRQITRRVGFSGWLLSPALSSSDFLLQSSAHRDPISASSIQKDGILPRAVAAAASIVVSSRLSLHQEQSPHLTVQSHFNRCKQCNIFRPLDSGVENLCLYPSENWSNLYLKASIPTDGKKYINQIKGNHVFCTLLFYFSKVA